MDIQALSQPVSESAATDFGNSIDDVVNPPIDYHPLSSEYEHKTFDDTYPREEPLYLQNPFDQNPPIKSTDDDDLYSQTHPLSPAYFGNTIDAEANLPDGDYIFVFVLLKIPHLATEKVWKHLRTSIVVTLLTNCNSSDSIQQTCPCEQQFLEMPATPDTIVRELSVQIPLTAIRAAQTSENTNHLFQLFLSLSESKDAHSLSAIVDGCPDWNKIEVVSFIHLVATSQPLRPIPCELTRHECRQSPSGIFIGSFSLQEDTLFHHIPTDESLKLRAEAEAERADPIVSAADSEQVVIVSRDELIPETNGARSGRPMHKETQKLLMTRDQVEKLLEIRARWSGLSPRQRRDMVTRADFFPFFTINRDETAYYLGVCATWLKDAIRAHGVNMWPGRPLRRSGALLQNQKENLESAEAKLQYTSKDHADFERYTYEIARLKRDIMENVQKRVQEVKKHVSPEYFKAFIEQEGEKYVNPVWNALPPSQPRKRPIEDGMKSFSPEEQEQEIDEDPEQDQEQSYGDGINRTQNGKDEVIEQDDGKNLDTIWNVASPCNPKKRSRSAEEQEKDIEEDPDQDQEKDYEEDVKRRKMASDEVRYIEQDGGKNLGTDLSATSLSKPNNRSWSTEEQEQETGEVSKQDQQQGSEQDEKTKIEKDEVKLQ